MDNEISCLAFRTQLNSVYSQLTLTEKRIADFIGSSPERILGMSAADIADAVGVSPATVIRFSKSCGFAGFSDMKSTLRREKSAEENPNKSIGIKETDSRSTIRHRIVGYHMDIVNFVLSGWNEAAYWDAVNEVRDARQILIVGYGGSKAAAVSLTDFLLQIGIHCTLVDDPAFAAMQIGCMGEEDVVISICYTGRYRDTVEITGLAADRKITVIAITGYAESPLVDIANLVLITEPDTFKAQGSAFSARISELIAVEILMILFSEKTQIYPDNLLRQNKYVQFGRMPKDDIRSD